MTNKLTISLNGTNENPFHRMGLICNPFPQLAKAEYDHAERVLAKLGGDPIPNEQYIRDTLKGFGNELIELCVKQFVPGKMVKFEVEFED